MLGVLISAAIGGIGGFVVSLISASKAKRARKEHFGVFSDDDQQWVCNGAKLENLKRPFCIGARNEIQPNVSQVFTTAIFGGSVRFESSFTNRKQLLPSYFLQFNADGTITGQELDRTTGPEDHRNLEYPITGFYDRKKFKLTLDIPAWKSIGGKFKTFHVKCRMMWEADKHRFIGIAYQSDTSTERIKEGVVKLMITHFIPIEADCVALKEC